MKNNYLKGDWQNLVTAGFNMIEMDVDEEAIKKIDLSTYKNKHKEKCVKCIFQPSFL